MIGIYKITSPSKKIYIGQSRDIRKRFYLYKKYKGKTQPKLYKSFLKYGVERHIFEIIKECSVAELNDLEIYYIKHFDSTNNLIGLNLSHGGYSSPTEEAKVNMSMSSQKYEFDKLNTKYNIKDTNTVISIRLSYECFLAYKFLQKKKINPAKYLRDGGEKLVIEIANKNKFTL